MSTDLLKKLTEAVSFTAGKPSHLPDEDSQLKAKSHMLGSRFSSGLEFLIYNFPNPRINAMTKMAGQVFENGIVPVALGPQVPTLSFAAIGQIDLAHFMVLMPHNWAEMIDEDGVHQIGAIVTVASQACDTYHRLLLNDPTKAHLRSQVWEAEFLRTLKENEPSWKPNPHQTALMKKFPDGVDDKRAVRESWVYTFKPFVKPS